MKKLVMTTMMISMMMIFMMISTVTAKTAPTLPKGIYPYFAKVYTVKKEKTLYKITTRDRQGRMFAFWSYDGDWFKGDGVAMIMWNCGTPRVADDMVLSARYIDY